MLGAALFAVTVTYLHISVFGSISQEIILEEFYYLPILLGAFFFGLRGSLLTYAFVSLLYLPFFFGVGTAGLLVLADRVLHLGSSGLFAVLAGFLVDRERRLQRKMERERYLANVGQVATAIVHDLKNPLIVISGFAKRIRDGKGDATDAAQTIIESAEKMQKIVFDVLDFSKPIQLEMNETDLRGVMNEVVESCRMKAKERGVTLLSEMPKAPVSMEVDNITLQRALINLVNNAIEASAEQQTVTVTLSVAGSEAVISIRDRGAGMDRETLEHLFVPFFTKKSGGTGLGMAIAKKIIEGHRGGITVLSAIGTGTEISVRLPRRGGTK